MEDMNWVARLAYLSNIFERINVLNTSLQGKECHVFLVHDKVSAFRKKLDLWCARVMFWRKQDWPSPLYNR